jgi:hypothetical protein
VLLPGVLLLLARQQVQVLADSPPSAPGVDLIKSVTTAAIDGHNLTIEIYINVHTHKYGIFFFFYWYGVRLSNYVLSNNIWSNDVLSDNVLYNNVLCNDILSNDVIG